MEPADHVFDGALRHDPIRSTARASLVSLVHDPALLARVVGDGVPLTVCPTSNVAIGVVESMAAHPVRTMLSSGVHVTINSGNGSIEADAPVRLFLVVLRDPA
jgi:hypothetical protein